MKTTNKLDMIKRIFADAEIQFTFLGNQAILEMENGLIGEVTLGRGNTSGSWTGLHATVRSKTSGEIASNVFSFEQYLGENADRTHQNASHIRNMYVWEDNGKLDWYIVRPTSTEPILDAICEYLLLYGRK